MGAVTFEQIAGWDRAEVARLLDKVNAEYAKRPKGLDGGFDQLGLRLLAGEKVVLPNWLIAADFEDMPVMPIQPFHLSIDDGLKPYTLIEDMRAEIEP